MVAYCRFPRPETRFTLVVTLLLISVLLPLASLNLDDNTKSQIRAFVQEIHHKQLTKKARR